MQRLTPITVAAVLALAGVAHAADWSDTSVSLRTGSKYAEPFGSTEIGKVIGGLTHASGYKYGSNFFNVDLLMSDSKNPGGGTAGKPGAQEVYVVYRNTLDFGKISGSPIKFGPFRGAGLTLGVDFNTKNDGYASKKRMLVVGPTLSFDVPGFADLSALILSESNAPAAIGSRYNYQTHGALQLTWGVGIPGVPLASFGGYAMYIASKGKNEFGGDTAAETNIDANIMFDVGALAGGPKKTFLLGLEYQYWKNKFGNPTTSSIGPGAGPGATAKTPQIRDEYHF